MARTIGPGIRVLVSVLLVVCGAVSAGSLAAAEPPLVFAVTADMRSFAGQGEYDSRRYFRGACEAISALGGVSFMVSPGDVDPPGGVRWTLDTVLGGSFPWFPAAGNHDAETPADMAWLRALKPPEGGPAATFNPGPAGCRETTYSFDAGPAHFAVLNEYCDGTSDAGADGDVSDAVFDWLDHDLRAISRPHVFVVGHEPAWVKPDAGNRALHHLGESLDKHPAHRDRFWSLLVARGVRAYLTGHTHCFSAAQVDGVWQLDVGHARGAGDTRTRSTFVIVRVSDASVSFEAYREAEAGGAYALVESGSLAGPKRPIRRTLRPGAR